MANNVPNLNLSLLVFSVITVIYFVAKYLKPAYFINKRNKIATYILYIFLILSSFFGINLWSTSIVCGSVQAGKAAEITFIPGFIIFGLLQGLLTVFPGWLNPFKKTIGTWLVSNLPGSGQDNGPEIIAEFIWTILSGILTILVAYNYFSKAKCNRSVENIEAEHKKPEDQDGQQ